MSYAPWWRRPLMKKCRRASDAAEVSAVDVIGARVSPASLTQEPSFPPLRRTASITTTSRSLFGRSSGPNGRPGWTCASATSTLDPLAKGKKFTLRGRDAGTGRFLTLKAARKRKKTAVVERIPLSKRRRKKS
jgi:hypothetical protein